MISGIKQRDYDTDGGDKSNKKGGKGQHSDDDDEIFSEEFYKKALEDA
jgi:hypothetical protein